MVILFMNNSALQSETLPRINDANSSAMPFLQEKKRRYLPQTRPFCRHGQTFFKSRRQLETLIYLKMLVFV